MRGNTLGLCHDLFRRHGRRRTGIGDASRVVGASSVVRDIGITERNFNVVEWNSHLLPDDLGKGRVVTLARRHGTHLNRDLASTRYGNNGLFPSGTIETKEHGVAEPAEFDITPDTNTN